MKTSNEISNKFKLKLHDLIQEARVEDDIQPEQVMEVLSQTSLIMSWSMTNNLYEGAGLLMKVLYNSVSDWEVNENTSFH